MARLRYIIPIIALSTEQQIGVLSFTAQSMMEADAQVDRWNSEHLKEGMVSDFFQATTTPAADTIGTIILD